MDPILLDISGTAQEVMQQFSYLGPFLILLLCGLGLPLPEEVTLIGSGLLVYQDKVDFLPITVVCSVAILLGDAIPFWLGRHYGKGILKRPWISLVLHPERFSRLENRFLEHGNWATFVCRFLPGIRIPGYFVAGMMRMKFIRFLLLDALGVLFTVPLSIHVGRLFGGQMEMLNERMEHLHQYLAFLVIALLIILLVVKRKSKQAIERAKAGVPGPVTAAAEMHAEPPSSESLASGPNAEPPIAGSDYPDGIDDPARPA
jgi:membrane protein DedA with SNARE-associated domain